MEVENHLIFSDESGYCGNHRHGAIAVISGSKSNTRELNSELQAVLDKYDKIELKFAHVKGHSSSMQAVKEFITLGLKYCCEKKIKIHVIVWDTRDSRHQVFGRSNIENLKRMYYHILKRTKSDWNSIENWEFYPDEFSAIDWKKDVVYFIERTNLDKKLNIKQNTLFGILLNFRFPLVHKHGELESAKYPILQLSDLFAGLNRLSHEFGETFNQWLSNELNRNSLFPELVPCNATKNMICKFQIMKHFKDTCSKYKLGVNFSNNKYFTTFSSKNGIVIWLYQPQGEYDKAPVTQKLDF